MVWYLKQLLPLSYRSHYGDSAGQKWFAVWRMSFGRCFDVEVIQKQKTS